VISEQWEKAEWNQKKWYTINYESLGTLENSVGVRSAGQNGVVGPMGPDWPHRVGQLRQSEKTNLVESSRANGPAQGSQFDTINTETSSENLHQLTDTDTATLGYRRIPSVCGSRYSIEEIMRYLAYCSKMGDIIKSPRGLAIALLESGKADPLVENFLESEGLESKRVDHSGCPLCLGTGWESIDGKARRCTRANDL